MKRILLFIDSLNSGGAQRQLVYLARLLNYKGYDVKVVTYYEFNFFKPELVQAKISYENLRPTKWKFLRVSKLSVVLTRYKPDVVISFLDTPNIISSIANCFSKNRKVIVSERNTSQRLDTRTRIRLFLFRFADVIIVNSSTQKNFITKYSSRLSPKIEYISNTVDLELFNLSESPIIEEKSMIIGVIGRFQNQKNAIGLINAVKVLNADSINVKVYWYGNNFFINGHPTRASEYYLTVKQEIKNQGIEDIFILKDTKKEVESIYSHIDAFCLPSYYEGFPNVVAEAIASGKPILASAVGDIPLMVKEGENGFLFDPYSTESIVSAFQRFHNLKTSERIIMGRKSRDIAINLLSEDVFLQKYVKVIEQ